ncbi:hypothetical protein POM88_010389 [Heracleum sosnowskyi]|uniref:Ubiquitin-like protease family profile domain-containing protein n=1 Tax=Heracleum sosnowskyi TaxID=360622 RepID=A0AAD8IUL1_9APIA|nr:hypothetical protein POM88_010389 [Heracleum sosnowskyi]
METEFGSGVSQVTLAKKLLLGGNCNQYSYMLFPVFKYRHYSLAIVCFLDEEENLGPIVLHMDSMSAHNSNEVFDTIEWFLEILWKNMNGANTTIPRVSRKVVEVPQQPNSHDCAYFVMHMMRLFLEQAPLRFKMEHLQMFDQEWFKPEDASALRDEMRPVMEKELNDYFTSPLEEYAPEPHIEPLQPLQKRRPPIKKTYQKKKRTDETRDLRSELITARGTRRKMNEVDYTEQDLRRNFAAKCIVHK